MTIRHLKTARSLEARAEDDAKTRAIVESGSERNRNQRRCRRA